MPDLFSICIFALIALGYYFGIRDSIKALKYTHRIQGLYPEELNDLKGTLVTDLVIWVLLGLSTLLVWISDFKF